MAIQEPFHIWYERSGGFAGMTVTAEMDSKNLTPGECKKLQTLIDGAGFFEFQKEDSLAGGGPDRFQYKITIEQNDRKKTVELDEAAVPASFRPLLQYLSQHARPKR